LCPAIDGSFCTEPQATTLTMDRRDNARTEELNNLRLALAAPSPESLQLGRIPPAGFRKKKKMSRGQ
jgi:hypothetical protein